MLGQPGLGEEREREKGRGERGSCSPSQGTWPQSGMRCCPNGNRNAWFSKVGSCVSENIYLSPMHRLEDIKGTFCPESNLGQFFNWL